MTHAIRQIDRDIERLIETSYAIEENTRNGDYCKDDRKALDAMAAAIVDASKVKDAIKRGKIGVAIFIRR